MTPRRLRHHLISQLMKCASAEAVRGLAGHSRLEMTQRYAHAGAADASRAAIDRRDKEPRRASPAPPTLKESRG
jgi:hypothetical protein